MGEAVSGATTEHEADFGAALGGRLLFLGSANGRGEEYRYEQECGEAAGDP